MKLFPPGCIYSNLQLYILALTMQDALDSRPNIIGGRQFNRHLNSCPSIAPGVFTRG
ncbi:MAG: hypothetical protein ABSE63_07815 [Thermoguttaceae bacterium]